MTDAPPILKIKVLCLNKERGGGLVEHNTNSSFPSYYLPVFTTTTIYAVFVI